MILPRLGHAARHAAFYGPSRSVWRPLAYSRASQPHLLASRVFTSTPCHRKEEPRSKTLQQDVPKDAQKESITKKPEDPDTVRPETIEKPKPNEPPSAGQQDSLLSEKTVSSKEQRQADWAIIKEMSKYLWPKDNLGTRLRVGVSVGLLIGAKVNQRLPAYA